MAGVDRVAELLPADHAGSRVFRSVVARLAAAPGGALPEAKLLAALRGRPHVLPHPAAVPVGLSGPAFLRSLVAVLAHDGLPGLPAAAQAAAEAAGALPRLPLLERTIDDAGWRLRIDAAEQVSGPALDCLERLLLCATAAPALGGRHLSCGALPHLRAEEVARQHQAVAPHALPKAAEGAAKPLSERQAMLKRSAAEVDAWRDAERQRYATPSPRNAAAEYAPRDIWGTARVGPRVKVTVPAPALLAAIFRPAHKLDMLAAEGELPRTVTLQGIVLEALASLPAGAGPRSDVMMRARESAFLRSGLGERRLAEAVDEALHELQGLPGAYADAEVAGGEGDADGGLRREAMRRLLCNASGDVVPLVEFGPYKRTKQWKYVRHPSKGKPMKPSAPKAGGPKPSHRPKAAAGVKPKAKGRPKAKGSARVKGSPKVKGSPRVKGGPKIKGSPNVKGSPKAKGSPKEKPRPPALSLGTAAAHPSPKKSPNPTSQLPSTTNPPSSPDIFLVSAPGIPKRLRETDSDGPSPKKSKSDAAT
mmetsp:Transcript_32829/g.103934  ORF Transcript_32829/g.103934 Transcript_32829/m.103934 type:complete len:534 (+) Transcript_32829:72-1673(+)